MSTGYGTFEDPTDEDAQIAAIADLQRELFEHDLDQDREDEPSAPPHLQLQFAGYNRPTESEETMIQNMLDVDYSGAGVGIPPPELNGYDTQQQEHEQPEESEQLDSAMQQTMSSGSASYGAVGDESADGTPNRVPAQFAYVPDDDQGGSYSPSYPGAVGGGYSPSFPNGMDDGENEAPPHLSLDENHAPDVTAAPESAAAPEPIPEARALPPSSRTDTPMDLRSSTPVRPLDTVNQSFSPFPSSAMPASVQRLEEERDASPKSDLERLSDRLQQDPHDGQLWQEYINLVDQSGDLSLVESAYERLIAAFPNTVRRRFDPTSLRWYLGYVLIYVVNVILYLPLAVRTNSLFVPLPDPVAVPES